MCKLLKRRLFGGRLLVITVVALVIGGVVGPRDLRAEKKCAGDPIAWR
ncbi:MAG: hypothetical protein M5R38_04760 [Candidatus Methylomirabilis sp.]|nr:hypothetical protein [Candidatus Methylomirabilis sp.]